MGEMKGSKESYSFWKSAGNTPTHVYGMNEQCSECDNNVALFELDGVSGHYRIIDGDHDFVATLLNEQVEKMNYSLGWTRYLRLENPIFIYIGGEVDEKIHMFRGMTLEEAGVEEEIFDYHLVEKGEEPEPSKEIEKTTVIEEDMELTPYHLITVTGEVDELVYVEAVEDRESIADSSDDLKRYLDMKDYAVGDSDDNVVLKGEEEVTRDMEVVIMKRIVVVIEMDETNKADDVVMKEVAKAINSLTSIEMKSILVDTEVNEKGYVKRIIVILREEEMCEKVINSVNELDKNSACSLGVLCHSVKAYRFEDETVSKGQCNGIDLFVASLMMLITAMVNINK